MAERNPDWDNRLGEGDLMEVTEKWLNKQKKRLRVREDTNLILKPISASMDKYGQVHVRFQAIIRGIPIEGKEIIVHISERTRDVLSVQGTLKVEDNWALDPTINKGNAVSALAKVGVNPSDLLKDTELVLYVRTGQGPKLAWRIDANYIGEDGIEYIDIFYVDALSGENFARLPQIIDVKYREIHDSAGTSIEDPAVARGETDEPVVDDCVNEAYDNLGITYKYYDEVHGRDSWNDSGVTLTAYANWDFGQYSFGAQFVGGTPFPWSGYFRFGQAVSAYNCSTTLDVVGHEFTHGVLRSEASLATNGEAGSLGESIGDVFGAMVEAYNNDDVLTTDTWNVAEGIFRFSNRVLRSIKNPPLIPGHPDHYDDYDDTNNIHINAGIPSKAFYLVSQGGTHSNIEVNGIGHNIAAGIWYDAIISYMNSGEMFSNMRIHTMLSALKDPFDYNSDYFVSVANAWAAAGVGEAMQSSIYSCQSTSLNQYETQIIDFFIAYYGRAGNREGINYWAQRLENEGLGSIMPTLANSAEFDNRFGGLDNTELVTNLFWQTFNRAPGSGGLTFFVNELNVGTKTLADIALDLLSVGPGNDRDVLNNRRVSAEDYYVRQGNNSELNLEGFALIHLMQSISGSSDTLGDACGKMVLLDESTF